MTLLSVQNLSIVLPVGADRSHAVSNVSFDVDENQIVCLVGESGSGKSMIAHALLGLLPAGIEVDAGALMFQGMDLARLTPAQKRAVRGDRISMIFQEPLTALNPLKRVGEQVAEAVRIHAGPMPAKAVVAKVEELFEQVGLPDPPRLRRAYPFQLSGGQRQRVMIAMALCNNPKLLIADEPTTALDVTTQRQILDLIKSLQKTHDMGVLFITHDIGVVADIADKVVVLQKGGIVESGEAKTVLTQPTQPYTRMLLDAVPGRGAFRKVGRSTTPVLEVRGLQKRFVTRQGLFAKPREVVAARDVSCQLAPGDTLAVVGESGSGKSTLARILLRLVEPDAGEILWHGASVRDMNRKDLRNFRRKVQIVFQDPYSSLDPRLKVGESICRGPMAFGTSRIEAKRLADRWLERVGLGPQAFDRFPHEFSGGQRQRICIARALALQPEILIADEAVSALDVSIQAQVLDLLNDLKVEMGLAMIFITHDLRVAREIADRVLVMRQGQIEEERPTEELFESPRSDYTKRLLDAVPGRSFFAARAGLGVPA
ncbi:Nickel-transporting ATPase, Phosphonate-transporting ATPase [Rhizobium sp. CF080]|uniref:ABC transporter ATP-binding protein n=1 Tax=Rhizobium sp. (strain CF080) TaxID=1144310 RepID=UPI000271C568|nr:ABC transporter ATP-binding protein [Rhizobium sp. CF080]EUB99402.1 Nickel-transporting ATPase, Phosphonate-transporting ATPase [Rhizobium sp. CF080]